MLELKKDQEGRIIMYGCNDKSENDRLTGFCKLFEDTEIIFSGTKSELLQKDEEFWNGICEMGYSVSLAFLRATESKRTVWRDYTVKGFQSLKGSKRLPFKTAKESGHSALSLMKEDYILITKTNHL